MDWSRDALTKCGFIGFVPFAELPSTDVPAGPGRSPLGCALWGLQNNRAEDGDYPGTVEALLAAGAPTRHSAPIGDEAVDAMLAKYTATT